MRFKNILFSIFIGSFLIIQGGCELLDIEPKDKLPAEDAIKDKRGLESSIAGVYDALQSAAIAQDVILFADILADNMIHIGTKKEYRQISDNRIAPENAYVEDLWNQSYDAINRVNNILEALPEVDGITEEERERFRGECYFLRAFNYFYLANYYGGLPLRKEALKGISPGELNMERSSLETTLDFIEDDLELAIDDFENKNVTSNVYGNYYAAKALLARLHLYRENFEEAEIHAKDVIQDSPFDLESGENFANIFNEGSNSSEIIFQVDFLNDEETNSMADWCLPSSRFEVAAWETYDKERSVADEYENNDLRKDVTIGSTMHEGRDEYYCLKYDDAQTDNDNSIFIRLAEMYLIVAESLNEQGYVANGDAFDYLNAIHARAGLDSLKASQLTNQDEFREAILKERRLEFAFEGHRFFDLRRTGEINDVLPNIGNLRQNGWLLPIPQSELDTNEDMVQNGDY